MRKVVLTVVAALTVVCLHGAIKVSDVEVFSGYPWKEVVVGYTITGTDANADAVRLTATDKVANKSYTSKELIGAKLTEGRHVLRWNAASEGVKFSSGNVVFAVSVVAVGVQLWENGPYWAECNVGATKPEEFGYYFWWGDTIGYKRNNGWVSVTDGSAFRFDSSRCPTYDKSISQLRQEGYIDVSGNLVAAHDAATQHWGMSWRMPTDAEIEALIANCTETWTSTNGVYCRCFRGKGAYSSKSIILPFSGSGSGSSLNYPSSNWAPYGLVHVWSSTPDSDSNCAWQMLSGTGDSSHKSQSERYKGQTVRPVRGFAQ